MAGSVPHIEYKNRIITICFGYYFTFGYVHWVLKGYIVFFNNMEATSIYRHPDITLSYLQFSLFQDNRKKLNKKKLVICQHCLKKPL